jgi:hypothetical protein
MPPPEPEPINMRGYYKYPKFRPLSRDNCTPTVNLPNILTDPLKLFHLFFSREIIEGFVRVTNTYAEIKRQQTFDIPKSVKIRFREWKSITIKKVYIFLAILIYIGSDKQPSFK